MRTTINHYDEKKALQKELIGDVTEISTEKQMTIFPGIKEKVVIFRFRQRVNLRSGFLEFYDPIEEKVKVFTIVKNLNVSKGTTVYGSERRGGL